jgi:quercetin dioxygenase-like cupin family protein
MSTSPHYQVDEISEVARAPGVWVREFTVQPGQEVPWHQHTEVRDRCYALQGEVRVEIRRAGEIETLILAPGESCTLDAQTPHRLTSATNSTARYLLVQVGNYDFIKVPS